MPGYCVPGYCVEECTDATVVLPSCALCWPCDRRRDGRPRGGPAAHANGRPRSITMTAGFGENRARSRGEGTDLIWYTTSGHCSRFAWSKQIDSHGLDSPPRPLFPDVHITQNATRPLNPPALGEHLTGVVPSKGQVRFRAWGRAKRNWRTVRRPSRYIALTSIIH